jgi:hypothetical protein
MWTYPLSSNIKNLIVLKYLVCQCNYKIALIICDGPIVPYSYFVGGSNLNNLQNRIENQIRIQNSKIENRKRIRSRKK